MADRKTKAPAKIHVDDTMQIWPGALAEATRAALAAMEQQRILTRIWQHDHTIWSPSPEEISNRLGWLHSPENMPPHFAEINAFVDELRKEGFTQALLLGMGGSSLAPEVFRLTFDAKPGYLDLSVLDSTDPGAVLAAERRHNAAKTIYIVSTKSGGTIETLSFCKYFFTHAVETLGQEKAGRHFAAITDPGSGLAALAERLGFRKIFLNDPDIGGRYSALSFFGLMPAALTGVDLTMLMQRATAMVRNNRQEEHLSTGTNSAAWLGCLLGEAARAWRDKMTLLLSPQIESFGTWVEQLVAESTGKEGKGIVPVHGEPAGSLASYGDDRIFIHLRLAGDTTHDAFVAALTAAGHPVVQLQLKDVYDLGGEFFRWELATAIASWRLQLNPFDQPDVESAKIQARKMMDEFIRTGALPAPKPVLQAGALAAYADFAAASLPALLQRFLAKSHAGKPRSYIALQAYVAPSPQIDRALADLAGLLRDRTGLATTIGYGPRFLHSTGQLHKGDAGHGLFIQMLAEMPKDAPIPEQPGENSSSFSFAVLKMAQALGDRQALIDGRRPVLRFDLGTDIVDGLRRLSSEVEQMAPRR